MRKIGAKDVFEGVLVLGFLLFVDVSFMAICLHGLCTKDWLIANVVGSTVIELLLVFWIVFHIRRGAVMILISSRNLENVKDLFLRLRTFSIFGLIFGFVNLCGAIGIFNAETNNISEWHLVYALNIITVSLFFFVWAFINIQRITDHQKLGNHKKIGYRILVSYFYFNHLY